jgi:hypothetical protein
MPEGKDKFRTLDDPDPVDIRGFSVKDVNADVTAGRIVAGAFYADGLRTGYSQTCVPVGRPNLWRRFWWWFLLGVRWESR